MSTRIPRRIIRRTGSAMIGGILLAGALALPLSPAAPATIAHAEETGDVCTITGGTMAWGVKESFRSYISGSIANGAWETLDGAAYDIPNFQWTDATGTIDTATGIGDVSFTGGIHFTGHDGILDLTLANPTIEFEGGGEAALLLDAKSTDTSGAQVVDAQQEWVGSLTTPADFTPTDGTIQLEALPTVLTNSGESAFAGFYQAGEELDPVTLILSVEGCGVTDAQPDGTVNDDIVIEDDTDMAVTVEPAETAQVPWLPITIGAIALVVIGVTTGMLIGGRKKSPQASNDAQRGDSEPGGTEA